MRAEGSGHGIHRDRNEELAEDAEYLKSQPRKTRRKTADQYVGGKQRVKPKPRLGDNPTEARIYRQDAEREFSEYDPRPVGGLVPEPGRLGRKEIDERRRRRLKPVKLGKRWSEIVDDIQAGAYTWAEFVETLDPTELARGQLKDKNGEFKGRPPAIVPRAFHDACIRELISRGKTLYQENYVQAINAMTEIAQNGDKDSDRIKAAQFVIERLEGKVPDKVEISQSDPFKEMIAGAVAEVAEDAAIANAQRYMDRME